MRRLALLGSAIPHDHPAVFTSDPVTFHGHNTRVGVVAQADPAFDGTGTHRQGILVRVKSFSCNFRDRAIVLKLLGKLTPKGLGTIGSEFSGVIEAIGSEVEGLQVGDRVLGDNRYAADDLSHGVAGIPSNESSRELLVLHQRNVLRIPSSMTHVEAAAFSIGAQTAWSMVRKLDPQPGDGVLITAARSSTAQFALQALRTRPGLRITGLTTTEAGIEELTQRGFDEVVVIDRQTPLWKVPEVQRAAAATKGFQVVVDPFFDAYLHRVHALVAHGGRYSTCGLVHQARAFTKDRGIATATDYRSALSSFLTRNVTFFGNCLGTSDDLRDALDAFADHPAMLRPTLDSVCTPDEPGRFFQRSFLASDRVGKVVLSWSD